MKNSVSLIPEVFYDFIGRVLPGTILIVSYYFFYEISKRSLLDNTFSIYKYIEIYSIKNLPTTLIILAIITFSYVLSFIFEGLERLFYVKCLYSHDEKNDEPLKQFLIMQETIKSLNKNNIKYDNYIFPSKTFLTTFLRQKKSPNSMLLAKIRAEMRLCSVLCLGWFLLSIITFIMFLPNHQIYSIILLLFSLALFKRRKDLDERHDKYMRAYFLLEIDESKNKPSS